MLSKQLISQIKSLDKKKFRDEYGLFVAEGKKLVTELSSILKIQKIYSLSNNDIENVEVISEQDMKRISFLKNPSSMLGIFHIPKHGNLDQPLPSEPVFALDDIQDPGNLGTIIRLCDWFGIKTLICSSHTADCYNPKVIQATMGAIARVKVIYLDLAQYLNTAVKKNIPVFGTFLNGSNIYNSELSPQGIIVLGNEGNGISKEVENTISHRLYIPSFSKETASESLNVAIAAAIVCSEFKRRG
ncbi:MAG: RNA methyltransferase [Prevotellaceae bacterium]|jgi:TrmH family RNA methyltransferase|nr:RNA methyltransferase [Prevotellaceae bacterium]